MKETIIIGSGVAGAAIAQQLLDANPDASITMLEAGSKVEMKDFAHYQNYVITGDTPYSFCQDLAYPQHDKPGENITNDYNLQLRGARLLMYGGSTVHWGGWSFRLKPEDFQLHKNTGKGIDWPISYDVLQPYYSKAEHYIGVAGDSKSTDPPRKEAFPYPPYPYTLEDEPLREAFESLDITYDSMPIARHGISESESTHAPCQTTGTCKYCPFGARYVAANYLDDMQRYNNYPNFQIIQQAFVQTINVSSSDKKTIEGVTYLDQTTGNKITLKADQVILAAGSIESAKLLLRSKSSGWTQGIGNDKDLVGRNLITHPYFIYQAEIERNPDRLQAEMNFPTMVSRYFDSEKEQDKGKFILVSPPGVPEPVNAEHKGAQIVDMMQLGMTREAIDKEVSGNAFVQVHGIIEVFSDPKNRVQNFDKVNHLGLTETAVTYTQPEDFDDRMEEVEKHIQAIFDEMGAKNMQQTMMSWRADHAACLTRMSDSDDLGVVDSDLKVFGTDNLFICSNAVFSSLGAVNPTLTLTALAIRLGEHLSKSN